MSSHLGSGEMTRGRGEGRRRKSSCALCLKINSNNKDDQLSLSHVWFLLNIRPSVPLSVSFFTAVPWEGGPILEVR